MLEGMVPYFKRALVVAVVLYAFFAIAQLAFAQGGPAGGPIPPSPSFPVGGPGTFPVGGNGGGAGAGNGNGNGGSPTDFGPGVGGDFGSGLGTPPTTQTVETPPVLVQDGASCWSSPQGFFHCIATAFFGTFVAIAGYAFDWSIQLFITQFGQMYITYGVGAVVEGTWGTVRDIFNLTFIFGLVYIGFQIILGVNESGAKRTIPLLIVAALLVNFSLFIVKFIVDFANLAALQIYNLFSAANTLDAGGGQASPGTIVDILGGDQPSISLAFLNTIGLTSLLSHNPSAGVADGVPLFYTFGMIVVFLVLIYVFFAAAILITIRFAALTFYMIFSPIMFLGWVFPGMKSYSDKFWQGLFGQAFFAPALLFMLYVTYQLSAGLAGPNRGDATLFQNQANAAGFAQFIPYLVLIVVFLMASLIVAKKMANQGASMVGKVNDWGLKQGRAALGGYGLAALGGYKAIDKTANSDSRLARFTGARTLAQGVSKYTSARDALEKSYKGSAFGSSADARKKRTSEMATRKSQTNLSNAINTKPLNTEDQIKFEQAITDASSTQIIKELDKHAPQSEEYRRIVGALSPSQVSKIYEAKDDEFSPAKKAKFAAVRTSTVEDRLTNAPIGSSKADQRAHVAKTPDKAERLIKAIEKDASADDLKHLGLATLRGNAAFITAAKMDDLKGKLSPTEWGVLNSERKQKLIARFEDDPFSAFKTFDGKAKKDIEIAKLPADILVNENSTTSLSTKVLEVILRENLLTSEDRAKIRKNVEDAAGGGGGRVEKMKVFLEESPIGQLF